MSERVDVQQLRDLLAKLEDSEPSTVAGNGVCDCLVCRFAGLSARSLPALLARLDALEEVAEAADMIHAHGPGAPTRQPDSCSLCASLVRLREGKA